MWPTNDGTRTLDNAEAKLVSRAIRVMVDIRAKHLREQTMPESYGIDWFDQWDVEQQLWLLEQIAAFLLTIRPPPSPAAIWEATIDAVFAEVLTQIELELDESGLPCDQPSWRQLTIDAFRTGHKSSIDIDHPGRDLPSWQRLLTQIADRILGVPGYQKAEMFRDGDIERARRFLKQRGLPSDFLQRMPPMCNRSQAEKSLARIMSTLDD